MNIVNAAEDDVAADGVGVVVHLIGLDARDAATAIELEDAVGDVAGPIYHHALIGLGVGDAVMPNVANAVAER